MKRKVRDDDNEMEVDAALEVTDKAEDKDLAAPKKKKRKPSVEPSTDIETLLSAAVSSLPDLSPDDIKDLLRRSSAKPNKIGKGVVKRIRNVRNYEQYFSEDEKKSFTAIKDFTIPDMKEVENLTDIQRVALRYHQQKLRNVEVDYNLNGLGKQKLKKKVKKSEDENNGDEKNEDEKKDENTEVDKHGDEMEEGEKNEGDLKKVTAKKPNFREKMKREKNAKGVEKKEKKQKGKAQQKPPTDFIGEHIKCPAIPKLQRRTIEMKMKRIDKKNPVKDLKKKLQGELKQIMFDTGKLKKEVLNESLKDWKAWERESFYFTIRRLNKYLYSEQKYNKKELAYIRFHIFKTQQLIGFIHNPKSKPSPPVKKVKDITMKTKAKKTKAKKVKDTKKKPAKKVEVEEEEASSDEEMSGGEEGGKEFDDETQAHSEDSDDDNE